MLKKVSAVTAVSATKAAKSPKSSTKSGGAIIDLTDGISLTIIKDAILFDGKYLSDTVVNIASKSSSTAQTIIFNDDEEVSSPLTYVCRESISSFVLTLICLGVSMSFIARHPPSSITRRQAKAKLFLIHFLRSSLHSIIKKILDEL